MHAKLQKNFLPIVVEGGQISFTHKRPCRYNCIFTWCVR